MGPDAPRAAQTPPADDRPPPRRQATSLSDLGYAIPWQHRLSTKVVALTSLICFGAVAWSAVAEYWVERQRIEGIAVVATMFSETIRNATRTAMRDNRKQDAYETMETIGRQPMIARVRLMNKEGKVTFSTNETEIGQVLSKSADACVDCHGGSARPSTRVGTNARVYEQEGHRVVGAITPIYNEPSCSTAACHVHPPERQILGVLDVGYTLKQVDEQLNTMRRSSVLVTSVGILLFGFLFWIFADHHLVRPVAALLQGTRRVAVAQLDQEIEVKSKDELGLLAASFNDMTRSLRRVEDELRQFNQDLEAKIEARTADLKAAQGALIRSEKLSSLGRLAASIAHEINNPLAGILTFAKLGVRTLEEGPPDEKARKGLVKNLGLVTRETERCSAIVRNLLDFARDRPLTVREVNLDAVVEESLQLVAHQLAMQGLTLEKKLAPLPFVKADFGQLRQAVVNVLLNAIEVMGKQGVLKVATRVVVEADEVELLVSDTGPGIAPEHLPRIFEPFFTTKEKGTGLGLSVVYGILQRHGGRVDVASELGKGTSFSLRLPIAKPEPATPAAERG